ncbi:exported hypothetical protein [Candidatus Sulfopaludibacter sp. SbA4]|nr:exported hypothetical protein [Candidatus Sulfopaludibacter sp. SbA4]
MNSSFLGAKRRALLHPHFRGLRGRVPSCLFFLAALGSAAAQTVTGFSPLYAVPGDSPFSLNTFGSGFSSGMKVNLVGQLDNITNQLTTTFVNSGELDGSVTSSLLSSSNCYYVEVGSQAPQELFVSYSAGSFNFSPTSAYAGSSGVPITLNGRGFTSGLSLAWKFGSLSGSTTIVPTTFVNSTQLTATIPANLLTTAGTGFIAVVENAFFDCALFHGFTINPSTISVNPPSLTFSLVQGGPDPPSQSLSVGSNPAGLSFTPDTQVCNGACDWLTINPFETSVSAPSSVTVWASGAQLTTVSTPTILNKTISLTASSATNSPISVPVMLNVLPTALSVVQPSLSFTTAYGVNPASQSLTVLGGNGPVDFFTVAQTNSGGSWLIVTPNGDAGYTPGSPVVSINVSGLNPGPYTGSVRVHVPGSHGDFASVTVLVNLTITPAVTVTTSPAGLQITVDNNTFTAPQTFPWAAGSMHTIAVPSPQGSGTSRSAFMNWSDSGALSHGITVPFSFTTTYSANFKTQYQLSPLNTSVSPPGAGTVTANPSSVDGFYDGGTPVQLTATANSGYQFDHWSGDLAGSNSSQQLTMNAPHSVTANFTTTCNYSLTTSSANFGAAASNGNTIAVTTAFVCGWSASSPVPWVVIVSGLVGNGNGNVTYNVLANPNSGSRSTTLTIAGQTFNVTQAGVGCQLSFNPASNSVGVNGGNFSLSVTLGADCAWSAVSNASWANITAGGSGTGNGTINYQVFGNQSSSVPRTGTITITAAAGDQVTFTITQAGNVCTYSLPQASESFLSSGGSGTFAVVAPPGCTWSVDNTGAPFVTITSGSPGSGNGSVNFTVPPTAAARSGTLKIAGQPFLVTQSAPGNNVTCAANAAAPTQAALEGRTELLGDLVVTCTGLSSPTTANINLTLNTDVTNLLIGTSTIDAQLVTGGNTLNGQILGYTNIVWTGVTIGPGSVRITNVRADASLLAAGGNLQPMAVTGQVSVNIAGPAPLTYTAQPAAGACGLAPANSLTMACAVPTLVFQKGQTASQGGVQSQIPAIFQEAAAGLFSNGAAGGTATRLRAVLTNIPGTVRVYAPLGPHEGQSLASLVSADDNGLGGSALGVSPGAPCSCAQLSVTGGTAIATWVVNRGDATVAMQYTFPMFVTTASSSDLSAIQIAGSLAPVSTVAVADPTAPIPRYRDFSVPQGLSYLQITNVVVMVERDSQGNLYFLAQATVGNNAPSGANTGGGSSGGSQGTVGGNDPSGPCTTASFTPPPPGQSTQVTYTCPYSSTPGSLNSGLGGSSPPADPQGAGAQTPLPVTIELDAFPTGMGLQVTCDTTSGPAPQVCNWNAGETHTIGVPQNIQTISPVERAVFNNWNGDSFSTPLQVVVSSSTSYAATFTIQYLLNASPLPANGGTVTPAPASSDGSGYFNSGSGVTLTATARTGFQFTGWTVDGSPNASSSLLLTMNGAHTVTANFSPTTPNTVPVVVTSAPTGLTVSVNGSACTTPCNLSYAPGTQVPISAATQTGAPGVNYIFGGWSDGIVAPHSVTIPQAGGTYIAAFTTQYQLTTGVSPSAGGSITLSPAPGTGGYYNAGTRVQLTPAPSPGFQFSNWSGDLAGSTVSQPITMNGPHNVTANFAGSPPASGTPSVVSAQPASGSGASQSFTFQFSDSAGAQDLSVMNVLINNALDGRQACYLAYVMSSSTLLLVGDTGVASGPYAGSVTLGNPNTTIQNSQCAVNLVSANVTGTALNLVLNVAFTTGFGGNKIQYAAAGDVSGANTGWQAVGVWQPPSTPTGAIAVASASPGRGAAPAGTAESFTFTWTDTSTTSSIGVVNVLVNNFIDGRNACYLAFVPSGSLTGTLYLVDDGGDAGGPFAGGMVLPGSTGAIQNSQCVVSAAGSSAAFGFSEITTPSGNIPTGTSLTLTLNITFKSAFAGNRILFVAGRDAAGANNTGWQSVGTSMVQ